MYNHYSGQETEATAAEKDAKFNKFVEQSKLDKVTKQNLKDSAKVAVKNPSRFRTAVKSVVRNRREQMVKKEESIRVKRDNFKADIQNARKSAKFAGRVAKASQAMSGSVAGIGKIVGGATSKPVDEMAIISGVLDIVDTIAQFMPPPASMVTGMYITLYSSGSFWLILFVLLFFRDVDWHHGYVWRWRCSFS